MEVHHATELVLGHLRVLHRGDLGEPTGGHAEGASDHPVQCDGESPPQVRCPPLPDHVGGVVVARLAQRLPDQRVAFWVGPPAAAWPAVSTTRCRIGARVAAQGLATPAVHRPEGGRGQGCEHERVLGHRLRDALAAGDPGPDQVEHVRGVEAGTRRAHRCPPVPAPHVGHAERLLRAGVGRDDLPGGGVDGLGVAVQPDRRGAVPDPSQRFGPGVKVPEPSRSRICATAVGVSGGTSSMASVEAPTKASGNSSGRVSVTACRVRLLTGLTTTKGVPRG